MSSKTVLLTIVRHGQTEANVEKLLHGWTDTSLNDMGVRQGHAAGQALKATRFHKAFSSDLQRANYTCRYIIDENVSSTLSSDDIIVDKLLRERNFGEFENVPFAAVGLPKLLAGKPIGGESDEDVKERARAFLKVIRHQVCNLI